MVVSVASKLVRVQSPDGTKRIEVNSSEQVSTLYQKVMKEFTIDPSRHSEWFLYLDRNKDNLLKPGSSSAVGQMVKHGDLIYLFQATFASESTNTSEPVSVEEDEVDQILAKQDGKIIRGPDEQL